MNTDGSQQAKLIDSTFTEADPNWEPGGDRIAFGCHTSVCLVRADGTSLTNLGSGGGPNWSPDGSKIVFTDRVDPVSVLLYTMNADGTNRTPITTPPPGFVSYQNPAWSSDGTRIVYSVLGCFTPSSCAPFASIATINPDGSGSTTLSCCPQSDQEPDWQPLVRPPTVDFKNAAKRCEAEREADENVFRSRYRNFGDCVSQQQASGP